MERPRDYALSKDHSSKFKMLEMKKKPSDVSALKLSASSMFNMLKMYST